MSNQSNEFDVFTGCALWKKGKMCIKCERIKRIILLQTFASDLYIRTSEYVIGLWFYPYRIFISRKFIHIFPPNDSSKVDWYFESVAPRIRLFPGIRWTGNKKNEIKKKRASCRFRLVAILFYGSAFQLVA